ncbi:MAG: ATP-binding protein [Planctomycetota bacterium]
MLASVAGAVIRANRVAARPPQIEQYLQHLSGPILDRIGIQLELEPATAPEMEPGGAAGPSAADDLDTSTARTVVARAREIQAERYRAETFSFNSELPVGLLRRYAPLSPEALRPLWLAMKATGLSARLRAHRAHRPHGGRPSRRDRGRGRRRGTRDKLPLSRSANVAQCAAPCWLVVATIQVVATCGPRVAATP